MPTATIYAGAGDGPIRKYGGAYSGLYAIGSVTGNDAYPAGTGDYMVETDSTNPMIYRSFFSYDIGSASIPTNAIVTAVDLYFYVTAKATGGGGSTANQSIAIVEGTPASNTTFTTSDYGNFGSTEWCTRPSIAGLTTSAYNSISLNSTGIGKFQTKVAAGTGYVVAGARIGYDVDHVTPTGGTIVNAQIKYSEFTGTSQDPYVVVTYVLPQVSITSDAIIKQVATGTVTSDAIINNRTQSSATSDAVVKATGTATVTADAVINPPSVQKTCTADAFISGTSVKTARTRSAYAAPVTVFSPGSIGTHSAHYAFPSLAKTDDGKIIAICRKGTGHNILDGDLVMKTSSDNGATWSSESTIVNHLSTGYDERDPNIRQLSTGRLVIVWSRAEAHSPQNRFHAGFIYSDDNGATWSAPVNMTTGHSANDAIGSDIIDLPNGDLICCTHGRAVEGTGAYDIRVSKSTDGGATWADLASVATGASEGAWAVEPQLVRMANGDLLCTYHIADGPPQTYKYKTSSDNGVTWSAATSMVGGGTSAGQTYGNRAGLEVHPDGDLVFAYTNPYTADSYFRVSTDNAATWTTYTQAIEVTQSTNPSQWYGGVWASPGRMVNSHARNPDLGVIAGFENSSQDSSEIRFRAFNSAATYAIFRSASVTSDAVVSAKTTVTSDAVIIGPRSITSDAKIIAPGTSTVSADAVIVAGSATQRTKTVTADAVIMARGVTRTLTADAIIASGAAPPGALVRPFTAPLVVSSATAPLVVSSATAPLSMETT